MSARKKAPAPQALHLDEPSGGGPQQMQIDLLSARLQTIINHGREAMSPHDLKWGYSPEYIAKLLQTQILVMLRKRLEEVQAKGYAALTVTDRQRIGNPGSLALKLKGEIRALERTLGLDKEPPPLMAQNTETTTGGGSTPPEDTTKGAIATLELVMELRKTRQIIESQLRDLRKHGKSKIAALRKAEGALLDSHEDDQMKLFDLDLTVSDEVRDIIANPAV